LIALTCLAVDTPNESSSTGVPVLEKTRRALEASMKKVGKVEALVQNFVQSDLIQLQSGLAEIQLVCRQQFADHPFWKLFWSSDYLISDLESRLGRQPFLKAEYQVLNVRNSLICFAFRCRLQLERLQGVSRN
jgi:hypothetical protein